MCVCGGGGGGVEEMANEKTVCFIVQGNGEYAALDEFKEFTAEKGPV